MRRLIYKVAAVAAMSMLFSCEREQVFESDSNVLGVEVNESASQEVATKASGDGMPYVFEVNGQELALTESVSEMQIETSTSEQTKEAYRTKGSPITAAGDYFDEFKLYIRTSENAAYTYTYGSHNYDGTPLAVNYTAADDEWTIASKVYWPENSNEELQFYATNSCDTGASQTVTETFTDSNTMHIEYRDAGSTSDAAAGEADLLYAYTKKSKVQGIQRPEDVAIGLQFHHAMAGIKFNFGTITNGLRLTNVTLNGIVTEGECDYTDVASGDSPTFNWTLGSTTKPLSQSFNTYISASSSGTSCDDSGDLSKTFYIIPQDITDDATVTFTFEYGLEKFSSDSIKHEDYGSASKMTFTTKPIKFSALSSVNHWDRGSLYTYTVSGNLVFAELGRTIREIASMAGCTMPNKQVKKITFSVGEIPDTKAPLVTAVEVQSQRSLTKIYATFDSDAGELVMHTTAPKIFLKANSCMFFDSLKNLAEIEGMTYIDTRNVTNMQYMFHICPALKDIDLTNFDTSNVTNMGGMFQACSSLTSLDLKNFDTSNVTDMQQMFNGCSGLVTLNMSNFDVSNVTTMFNMFGLCSGLTSLDLKNFDTRNVTDMKNMFAGCSSLATLNVSGFDTSNVTDMSMMFFECESLTSLDLSSFDTRKVTDMSHMFRSCSSMTKLNVRSFDTSNVTDMQEMFFECKSLTSLDLSSFDTGKATDMYRMFFHCLSLNSLDVPNFDTSKVADMQEMFYKCECLTGLEIPSSFNTSNVTTMYQMFAFCSSLTTLDLKSFDTSNVTNMGYMFFYCRSLSTLDIKNFDTSNVTNMESMFSTCTSLKDLDVSSFNTSKVTAMYGMFASCWNLPSLDLSNFDTSSVTGMGRMFSGCSGLTSLNVTNFNTSEVTDMSYMFSECSSLTSLDVKNFDTSKVTGMSSMFSECSSLKGLDLTSFNTSNVNNMGSMFSDCNSMITIDLSNFDTSNVTSLDHMFLNCYSLATVDIRNFDTSNVTNMGYMFYGCYKMSSMKLGASFFVSSTKSSMLFGFGSSVEGKAIIYCTSDTAAALSNDTGIDTDKVEFSTI